MINPCYQIVKGNIDEICNKIPSQFDKAPLYAHLEIMRMFLRDVELEIASGALSTRRDWGLLAIGSYGVFP